VQKKVSTQPIRAARVIPAGFKTLKKKREENSDRLQAMTSVAQVEKALSTKNKSRPTKGAIWLTESEQNIGSSQKSVTETETDEKNHHADEKTANNTEKQANRYHMMGDRDPLAKA